MGKAAGQPAWPGLDLMTFDSGMNPLLSTYVGAPYAIRGTDPASYATDARNWWLSLGQPVDPSAGNGVTVQPTTLGLPGWVPGSSTLNAVGIGAAGVLLALLVVLFGLLVLWKS